jgi:hypothetical protein
MDKSLVDEEWYALESKHIQLSESLLSRYEHLIQKIDHYDKQMTLMIENQDRIINKLDHLESSISHITQRNEHMEQRHHKENASITSALHELKMIKEREINIMIRERIPFPFGMPTLHASTPKPVRKPFSKDQPDSK